MMEWDSGSDSTSCSIGIPYLRLEFHLRLDRTSPQALQEEGTGSFPPFQRQSAVYRHEQPIKA